jgi:FtsH-binding integral membrane protein
MNGFVTAGDRARRMVNRVFAWMATGLALTGVMSYLVISVPALMEFFVLNQFVVMEMCALQLGLVMAMSFGFDRFSYHALLGMFLGYSALTGVSLSTLFLLYTMESLASAFFVSAAVFAVMAVYGMLTDIDLSPMGTFLRMALIGMIVALVINIFLQNQVFDLVMGIIGVVVFSGLTAYDMQRIEAMALEVDESDPRYAKLSIYNALGLYLNFINLFISFLRIMGRRK